MIQKLKLSRQEAAAISGECLDVIDDAIRAGDLRSFVVGRRRCIKPADLSKWVDWLQKKSDAGTPVAYRARA